MTDRLARGGSNRMRPARNPHVHGRLVHGRSAWYDPDPTRLLPDWECEHGRLEGDPTEPCGCFLQEALMARLTLAEDGGSVTQAESERSAAQVNPSSSASVRLSRDDHVRHFVKTCACGDLNAPRALVCVGCGRKLGVTV